MLAIEDFHVDVSVDHVVLVDEVLDVDQKTRHIVIFEKLEECVKVYFADFMVGRAGVVLVFGALGAFVVGRAGSSRLFIIVEIDVDVSDEILECKKYSYEVNFYLLKFNVSLDVVLDWSKDAIAAHFQFLHHFLDH